MYDVIIIGMGISGISAGLYAKQANLKTLMFESKMPGGLLNQIDEIKNYAGFTKIKGSDFAMNLFNQVNEEGIEYKNEMVTKIEDNGSEKIVYTNSGSFKTKNLVIATGRKPRFLGLDNEERLLGRGLSTCALCDGSFYKDKIVAVVGAGNSALQESLYLSKIVSKIYLLVRRDTFSGLESLVNEIKNTSNIEVLYETNIEKINEEDEKISSLDLNNNRNIKVDGLFIYAGYIPDAKLVEHLDITDNANYILVDENFETKIKGIYAIGDIIKKDVYQLVTAASDGAKVITKISKNK